MQIIKSILNILRFNSRNWKAVALCVFAATVFWFFNALNKTYTTNLRFPLRFEYDDQNFVPVRALPKDVRINVRGNGWNLFRRSIGLKIPPLEIPVERPLETKKIVGSTLPPFFANQLEGLDINFVLTDTLYVDLQAKSGRWISLALDTTDISLKKGYGLASNISILPDSVLVEGPIALIGELKEPLHLHIPVKNIDEQFSRDVEVLLPSSDLIKRNPPTVAVMFNVEKLITINDSVRLVITNLPSSIWPMLGRKRIPVQYAFPENMVNHFMRDSVKAILNMKDLPKGERWMRPEITGLPPFATVLQADSVRVKF